MAEQSYDLEQQKVIDISEGHHLVLAPPGCGKTYVLAQRVVAAQKNGVDFNDMLCLTFTNRAARNMRKRVQESVSSPNISELFVGNIHRFCSQFLFENKIIPMNTVILDEWEVEDIVKTIKNNISDRYSNIIAEFHLENIFQQIFDTSHYIDQILYNHPSNASLPYHNLPFELTGGLDCCIKLEDIIDKLRSEYYTIKRRVQNIKCGLSMMSKDEDIYELEYNKKNAFERYIRLSLLLKCAETYRAYKRDNDLLDFDDLLVIGYEYLRLTNSRYKSTYSWIQVDEVQDLNSLQLEIIECITNKNCNPCVIYFGDEQQAIYSFMGAAMESLEYLRVKCQDNIHHFGRNYRSPKYLLDLYNRYAIDILGVDPRLLPIPVNEQDPQKFDIFLKSYSSNIAQNFGMHDCLNYYLGLGDDEKVAILTSSNNDADTVSHILSGGDYKLNEKTGKILYDDVTGEPQREFPKISHVKISGRDFFSTLDMKTFLAHFNVVNFETNLLAWAQLYSRFSQLYKYDSWLVEVRDSEVEEGNGSKRQIFVRKCPICKNTFETENKSQYFCSAKCEHMNEDARSLMFKMRNIGMTPADIILEKRYLKDFCDNYKKESFVIFDTETTGLNVFEDDIIQIAAIKLEKGVVKEKFDVVIRTDRTIPAMLGNEINPMIEVYEKSEKVSPQEGLHSFIQFVGDSPILAHNLNYDYNILKQNFTRYHIVGAESFLNTTSFDSLKLIRLIEPRIKVYKLKNLIERLNLEGENSHNAEDDIIATKSLADYCFDKGKKLVIKQDKFLDDEYINDILSFFKREYSDIYIDSLSKLYISKERVDREHPAIIDNMIEVYDKLAEKRIIKKTEKFDYFINFLEQDVVELQFGQSLSEQLSRYLIDICTFKEADYCDSASMNERVFVSTVHKAKGLEFDNVIVLNGVEGTYPFFKFECKYEYPIWDPSEEDNQTMEGARLLYVAISRAKKRLCVSHYDKYVSFSKCYSKKLSRFIAHKNIREFFYPYPQKE